MLVVMLAVTAFALTLLLTGLFRQRALAAGLVDVPNERTSHIGAVPRGGGLGFVLVWSVLLLTGYATGWCRAAHLFYFLPAAIPVALIGLLDDKYDLSSRVRIAMHFLSALVLVVALGGWPLLRLGIADLWWGPLGVILAVVGGVWSINLFNFMDGTDAIASVESICVLVLGGAMVYVAGGETEGALAFFAAVCVAGFLYWNRPPARIFMGDVGSGFLGYLIAAFALVGDVKYGVPLLLWVILYGVFCFDATVTLIRRVWRGERFYEAHKSHAYQRLHQSGWPHGKVAGAVLCLNLLLAVCAVAAYLSPVLLPVSIAAALALLAWSYRWVERRIPMTGKR